MNTQINGKIHNVHGLEELILLKYAFYSKPSMDSVQSLSKSQWLTGAMTHTCNPS
jgi:hypothetical protein